jgi:hypothetical protein
MNQPQQPRTNRRDLIVERAAGPPAKRDGKGNRSLRPALRPKGGVLTHF